MRDEISEGLKVALKARDQRRTATLRAINAAIQDKDIAIRTENRGPATNEEILTIVQKMVKQREESFAIFAQAGRADLATVEKEEIDITVTQIVESVKKNGVIHPAVHSFSVGNELDLNQFDLNMETRISRAVQVVKKLNSLAPDHFITIPVSNAYEKTMYAMFQHGQGAIPAIPADIYSSRFYNSIQTFKLGGGDLENNILKAYDAGGYGVPLMITELGRSRIDAGSNDAKVDQVIGQAQAVRTYMDGNPSSMVKGFCIFQWQNALWKRDGSPSDVPDSTYGIHNYDGTLCASTTGKYMSPFGLYDSVSYNVDKLSPLTNATHPEGLLKALSQYFK